MSPWSSTNVTCQKWADHRVRLAVLLTESTESKHRWPIRSSAVVRCSWSTASTLSLATAPAVCPLLAADEQSTARPWLQNDRSRRARSAPRSTSATGMCRAVPGDVRDGTVALLPRCSPLLTADERSTSRRMVNQFAVISIWRPAGDPRSRVDSGRILAPKRPQKSTHARSAPLRVRIASAPPGCAVTGSRPRSRDRPSPLVLG